MKKTIEGTEHRREVYAYVRSGIIFFIGVNLFFGLSWVFLSANGHKNELYAFVGLTLLQIASGFFTYFNLKHITAWFGHIAFKLSVATLYVSLSALYELNKLPGDNFLPSIIFLGAIFLVAVLGYKSYSKIWNETLPQNISSGKIDLEKGVYSILTSPAIYKFKNKMVQNTANAIVAGSAGLIGLGSVIGIRVSQLKGHEKSVSFILIEYLLALLLSLVTAWLFYQYQWVRGWQKKSGRIMVTKYV